MTENTEGTARAAVIAIESGGTTRTVPFDGPVRIADLLGLHHVSLDLPCGGRGTCRQCRVTARGALSPLTQAERESLTEEERESGVRLACLTTVEGEAHISVPESAAMAVIEAGGDAPDYSLDPPAAGYGAAVDIGTTTLVVQLFRLGEREPLGALCGKNPQSVFGADVISRIGKAVDGEGEALARAVSRAVNGMLRALCARCGVETAAVGSAVVTGNTAMLYLLARESPEPLSHSPFTLTRPFGETLPASSLGIACLGETPVFLPRCMSAFVGADITCAVLAGGVLSQPGVTLLVDIGTNGEMALHVGGVLLCCSTAAGPAFEGAGIRMGVNAVRGAVDGVSLRDGEIVCSTIGNAEPVGICGSGLIDAVAVLLEAGVIDETGAIQEEDHPFTERVTELDDGPAVRLTGQENGGTAVFLTQEDIRQVQLAKSAVCAGMKTLLAHAGLTAERVDRLLVAGGFGRHIRLENAGAIGLIPPELCGKAQAIGNAAVTGAGMLLQNRAFPAETAAFARGAETVELAANPQFMEYYVEGMLFE